MTQVHPGIKIRLQYTGEIHSEVTYTSTLPLNQEGILSTQFSAQVFFSISSRSSSSPRHLQVIFIFKLSSSSDLDHHQTSSLDLDHHSIWIIITGSGSSWGHHHWIWIITQSGSSSLDLDHHSIWIITAGSGSSLDLDHLGDIITGSESQLDLDHHWVIIICAIS